MKILINSLLNTYRNDMEIEFSKKYYRSLDKFLRKHPQYATSIRNRIKLLKETPNHPSLRLHKLSNRNDEYSISIDQSIRIVFSRQKDICYLLEIGSHDEVY